jgi:hypothetical protein
MKRILLFAILCIPLVSCPSSGPTVTDLDPTGPVPDPDAAGELLLRFVQISDSQLVDEESPARAVRGDFLIDVAWRPQEAYVAQTLDAVIQNINAIHSTKAGPPIDFLIATGDLADNAQHNELRWFIDTMDGGMVLPDSGLSDGANRPVADELNPKLAFQATGLAADIPWYTVYGNHDALSVGVFGIARLGENPAHWISPQLNIVAGVLGLFSLLPPRNFLAPTIAQSPAILTGDTDRADPDTLQLPLLQLRAGGIEPDADRHYLNRHMFIEEHFNSTTAPAGHGFTESNRQEGITYYATVPKAGVPVRLIVMDTVAPNPPFGLPAEFGVLTRDQFESFVKPEIEAAQTAGEFVIIASHHPSEDFDSLYFVDKVGLAEFRTFLAAQPNVIAHICGHTHRHRVLNVDGPFPYLEIETASIMDFPQEGRLLDVFYDQPTETLRLESTIVGHISNPTMLSAESYRRAEIDMNQGGGAIFRDDQTAELFPDPATLGIEMERYKPTNAAAMTNRYGQATDRDFTRVFHRPNPARATR